MNDDDQYQQEADILGPPARDLDILTPEMSRQERIDAAQSRAREDLRRLTIVYEMHSAHHGHDGGGTATAHWLTMRGRKDGTAMLLLINAAVQEVVRLRKEHADEAARAMRIDMDLADVRGELGDCRRRLDMMQDQLAACDEFPGDVRVWPEDRS